MKSLIQKYARGLLIVPALALSFALGALVPATATYAAVGGPGGTGDTACSPTDIKKGISAGVNCAKPDSAADNLFTAGGIFQTVTNILLFIVGAISVIMLIVGGIRYVVSGGDQAAVTSAKNTILYAIIGIVVAFLAFAAVSFVIGQLETSTTDGT